MQCILLLLLALALLNSVNSNSNDQSILRKPLNSRFESQRLTTGPIFLLDTHTILVTQFTYKNIYWKNLLQRHNKWFRAKLHDDSIVNLELENGDDAHINKSDYLKINIILRVPTNTEYNIRDFSELVIINNKNITKSSVKIYNSDKRLLPDHNPELMFVNGKPRFFYPKCCPLDSFLRSEDCIIEESMQTSTKRIPVHDILKDKYNTDPTEVFYEMFHSPPDCNRFPLDEDENATLLINLELLYSDYPEMKLACIDWAADEKDNILNEYVFVCEDDLLVGEVQFKEPSNRSALTPTTTTQLFVILCTCRMFIFIYDNRYLYL